MDKNLLFIILLSLGIKSHAQFDSTFKVAYGDFYPLTLIQTGDVDNNGTIDVLAQNNGGTETFWYLNDGKGKFSTKKPFYNLSALKKYFAGSGTFFAAIADIDQSGKNDIICYANGSNFPFIFKDNNTAVRFDITTNNNNGISDLQCGDVDHDGDIDIILFYTYDNVCWLENKNDISNWVIHVILNSNYSDCGQLIDINKDGFPDIVNTSDNGLESDFFMNDGKGNFQKTIIENDKLADAIAINAFDVDKDGDFDVVAGIDDYDGNIIVFKNNKGSYRRDTIKNSKYEFSALAFADFDLDGYTDIIGGCWMGCGLTFYKNVNGNFTKSPIKVNGSGMQKGELKVADINNDGKPDLVHSNAASRCINWSRNNTFGIVSSIGNELVSTTQYKIKIFPNPSRNYLNVQFININTRSYSLKIFNIAGLKYAEKELYQMSNNQIETIDISNLKPGIYLLNIDSQYYKFLKD